MISGQRELCFINIPIINQFCSFSLIFYVIKNVEISENPAIPDQWPLTAKLCF